MTLFVLVGTSYLRERDAGRHDGLTGALGRRAGLAELDRWTRRRRAFTVAFVDLRDFKHINDTLGHSAGDDALRVIVRRLRHALRSGDLVMRYGGDEFVVASEMAHVAERIEAALRDPLRILGAAVNLRADIGTMTWEDGTSVGDIVIEADRRMYAAKRASDAADDHRAHQRTAAD
jgi:diguanylate cyclase (GGDEF)-like protein